MNSTKRTILGVAMTLATVATAFPQYEGASRGSEPYRSDRGGERSGYSYVRETVGGVTVQSRLNGRVTARRNMPISAGDEILVSEAGRAEIGLADGNLLFVGGGTRARFSSLYAQQGENDDFSAIDLTDGSVVLAATGANDGAIPRIDTEDATVYLSAGSRVRVNADPRRGTVVVVRAGSAEVRTRADSYTVEAGQYLIVQGDDSPEIARGVFSRDRFDLWAADRLDDLYSETTRSASVRYVDDDYASDVVALDDYGDWEYSSAYSTNVWVPRVSVGWTPYSYGSWYYTPIGLTWWSWDPWGWYPFHYGSWYFDAGFHHWCWAPAYTYSPAWVYWAYTPSYVGWCPTGYYSFYSPWWDNYYRHWGWNPRYNSANLVFALSGSFHKSRMDFGGWNFVSAGSFGSSHDRLNVVPGTRLVSRLEEQIAISPRPIVVSGRGDALPQALQNYVRQAPGLIERTNGGDASRLAPVLAREKMLPQATLEVLKDRAVVTGRGKLAGPGAAEIASRGMVVDRDRSVRELLGSRGIEKGSDDRGSVFSRGGGQGFEKGEKAPAGGAPASTDWRGRARGPEVSAIEREGKGRSRSESFDLPREKGIDRSAPAPRAIDDWRQKQGAPQEPGLRSPGMERQKPAKPVAQEENWRGRSDSRVYAKPAPELRGQEWRRSEPPAKRVIEGAVPGRRWQAEGDAPRMKENAPPADWRQRGPERSVPAPRDYRFEPREYKAPPQREYRPQSPRVEPREYKAPPQREYRPQSPRVEPREYKAPPAPRMESRPAPAPRAPDSSYKGHGKGNKG